MKREADQNFPKTPSRGTKPIKIFQKCQNEAGNGVKSPKNAFPRREMGKIFQKTALCDGKPIKFLRKRFRAAGRRLKISEIVFVRREMGGLEKTLYVTKKGSPVCLRRGAKIGKGRKRKGHPHLCQGMPFHINNPTISGYLAMPTRLRMKAKSKAVSLMLS